MKNNLPDNFHWIKLPCQEEDKTLTASEKYQRLVNWASNARGQNPNVFDSLTEWILDDSQWSEEQLAENKHILMDGVIARFSEQNGLLRRHLKALEPSGVVNEAVFRALDRFDDEMAGHPHDQHLQKVVSQVFADFSAMLDRGIRELIAGDRTGPAGTDSVDIFGYINCLKECDASVQWALFMPSTVERQQRGFKVERFEYKKMPAMRFIGFEGDEYSSVEKRMEKMQILRSLTEYQTELACDVFFMHHYGLGVDVGPWHGIWGRFMKADTPVPEGFLSIDFVPFRSEKAGPPYISQFAYATFSGDKEAMHQNEGFDSDAMYDITRNIMLGQGVNIPYPSKYWTAEVFPEGCDKDSTAYMFSAEL